MVRLENILAEGRFMVQKEERKRTRRRRWWGGRGGWGGDFSASCQFFFLITVIMIVIIVISTHPASLPAFIPVRIKEEIRRFEQLAHLLLASRERSPGFLAIN